MYLQNQNLPLLTLLGCLSCVLPSQEALGSRPNVVLILIDDLSHYGVAAYGATGLSEREGAFPEQPAVPTPRIDSLAQQGLLCEHAYAYPLCEPTRVALLTGQYNSRNFIRPKALHASEITISDVFQRAGYQTAIVGKWKQSRGDGQIAAKDYLYEFGWDEFCCFDVETEGSRFINPKMVVNGEAIDYKQIRGVDPVTGRRWYGPDLCNRYALDFIRRNEEQPFFLYYSMLLVHAEHTPTPGTEPKSKYDTFPDTPCHNRNCPGDDLKYFPDMLSYTDTLVGRLLDELSQLGMTEETLVVLMGDNGTKEPFVHHLSDGTKYPGGKGDTKDNGLHVPLLLRYPDAIVPNDDKHRPRTYSGLVDVVDLFPTLCDAAGIVSTDRPLVDGISFWPQATGSIGEHRDQIYTWYNANNDCTDDSNLLEYAFNKDYKRYAPDRHFPEGRFFNLREDLLEQSGDREIVVRWGHRRRSGKPLTDLLPMEQDAYKSLGDLIRKHSYVPVQEIRLSCQKQRIDKGESIRLHAEISPSTATRRALVWETDDSTIATINKFAELTAHQPGEVMITAYSWDSALPTANGKSPAYYRDGVCGSFVMTINDPVAP